MLLAVSCGDKDKSSGYDPNKPPKPESFYPQEGKFQENVMLVGTNFPTDPKLIKVYFNSRKAVVIGSSGTHMSVLAPRLPGKDCTISVVVGKDSLTFNGIFKYEESISVTTVAGSVYTEVPSEFRVNDPMTSVIQPSYLCADKYGNIFISNRLFIGEATPNECLMRLNEEEGKLEVVTMGTMNVPCADPKTGIISIPTEITREQYLIFDPAKGWIPVPKNVTWTTPESELPTNAFKHVMAVNPEDGCLYTRWFEGHIVRINPETSEAVVIANPGGGGAMTEGMTFRPGEPNILYIAYSGITEFKNGIYTIDVSASDPASTFVRVSSPVTDGGHRDGRLSEAVFHNPRQIFSDSDGFIYIADDVNSCIRRITPENQVETVLGIPGIAGFQDGNKKNALFDSPVGIAILPDGTVYVGDSRNGRIRKLSVN